MKLRAILTSFNGGELSPRLDGRVDLDGIYDRGGAEMYNFVSTVEGPMVKRSGFRHVRAAAATSTWLTSFVFNVTQSYVIEWLEEKLRFYTNGGRIESDPVTPYELVVPYTAAEAPHVSAVQSFDRLYLAHENHPPAALSRLTATTFAHADLTFKNGPFQDTNSDESKTVTVTGTFTVGGTATVTCGSAIFDADMVGSPLFLEAKDFSDLTAWEPGYDSVVVGQKRRSDGKAYEAASAGTTGTIQPTHTSGTEYDGIATGNDVNANPAGGVKWTYLHDRYGIGTITAVGGGGTTATITVTRRIPDSLGSVASHRWALGAFSEYAGWPHLVVIWAGRMIFFKGVEIFGSVVNDYGGGQVNFAPLTDSGLFAADMAFRRTLDLADPPLWVKADKEALIVGTAQGEVLIGAQNTAEALSGDNIQALPQSSYGSAQVFPIDIGTGALFVQRGGRKIREAQYTYEQERFVGLNITVWARHITKSGIKQMAFQQEPEEMLFGVRNDGVMIAHPHSPEQQVKGISRLGLGAGEALSCVAVPSEDGTKDECWILAELDGDKHVLQLGDWWDELSRNDYASDEAFETAQLEALKDGFFVDYGVSYDGTAKTEFTEGLDHLAERDVWVLADGGVVPNMTVSAAGELTLPYAAEKVHIGIGYEARFKPMRPEVRGAPTQQGLRKRIVKLVLRLLDASGLVVRDPLTNIEDEVFDRPGSSAMNEPVPLFNGDTENKSIGGGYDRAGQFVLVSNAPKPAIINAMLPTMEVEQ